jgi:DNA-binding CsgD family transcriptional regulator
MDSQRGRVLALPIAPGAAAGLEGGAVAQELIVNGRRYRLVSEETAGEPEAGAAQLLTPREMQIVALVAQGQVNKQIAAELRISEWTVSTHLRRIYAKLGVDTRAAMVRVCLGALAR